MLRKKAFTLIELLVVISIIAILMSIMMPALGKVRQMAKLTVCKTRLKNLSIATLTSASNNDNKLPIPYFQSSSQFTSSTWQSYVMKETNSYAGRDNLGKYGTEVFGFGSLWQDKYLEDPDIFICPGVKKKDLNMDYILRMLNNFDDDSVCKRIDAKFSYIPLTAKPHRISGEIDYWDTAKKAFELTSSAPLSMDKMRGISDFLHTKGNGEYAPPLINISFGDGHIVTSDNRSFFTKDKIIELKSLSGNAIIPTRDLFDFLDTTEQ